MKGENLMKITYLKTVGFRKFKREFETEFYDITNITGKNRSGKSNILYAIVNIMLGTNLSGDEKTCLVNNKCDASYGELHFTDNRGINHILIRGKDKYTNTKNFISLDGKPVSQAELLSFYKDKKLFLSIINPLYFLNKKPAEQKELVDKYLSDISPKTIFDTLTSQQQNSLIEKYFRISTKEIYPKLTIEDLQNIYDENNLQSITGKDFVDIVAKDKWHTICENVKELKGSKYYEILSPEEKEDYINQNMQNICMYIAFDTLEQEEKNILEGIPIDIPSYIAELNGNIKSAENTISTLDGKIDYAQNIADTQLPTCKKFEKEEELALAMQELAFLNTDQNLVAKEKQKQIIKDLENQVLSKETELQQLGKEMTEGKKKYLSIKNSVSPICPTCNQHIENESKNVTVNNMRNELVALYDKKNRMDTQLADLKIKLSIEKCKYHSWDGDTSIDKSKRIPIVEKSIKELENEKSEIEKFNHEIETKENLIKNAKSDIANFAKERKAKLKLIDNLKQCKKVAQKLYISYIEEKMKLAKQYLKDVNIQFYSVLKGTGEIKEDFVITYKNKFLSDLSRSETIATALEFANMFNQITKVNFPLFIDDYESCVDYNFINQYKSDTQLLVSIVQKGSPLKIADYNNSKNCTIIKLTITGYRTMKLFNNSNHALQQVA